MILKGDKTKHHIDDYQFHF